MMKSMVILLCFFILLCSQSFAEKAYPNPWVPESKNDSQGTLSGGITFDDLAGSGGEICIYDFLGKLVKRLCWESGDGSIKWEGKNDAGDYVASGVYLWKVKGSDSGLSKLVIIR
jgi:flagellar hook assembly protein FlgD